MEQVAAACDVSVDTVRYYQTRGLVPPPTREGRRRYPWDKMKKGDQFFVAATDEEARRTQQTLSTAACQYGKNHGMEFTTRRVEGGVRVWRIK